MVEHRSPETLRDVAQVLQGTQGVDHVEVVTDSIQYEPNLIHVLVDRHETMSRVPPRVLRVLAEHDCGVHELTPRDGHFDLIAY